MAYAEKRGKHWRARYKRADGTWASAGYGDDGSKFTKKQDAIKYGEEQEADVRRNLWRDPRTGDMLLTEWVNRWFPAQELEDSTLSGYRWHIEVHILPHFGDWPLRSLDSLKIAAWEIDLHRSGVCGATSAASARTLLHTILADAVRCGLIQANPAVRQRGRGRKNGRGRSRGPERAWATPLQVLLVAERAALLSGDDADFVRVVTLAYTGMRWAELVGLERQYFRLSNVRVEQQVFEHNGRWIKKPPKDDSYRTLAIPPFLSDLISRHLQANRRSACGCAGSAGCGGGDYVFLSGRSHEKRSNYARRRFRPAADGWHPGAGGKRPQPGRPVLADLAGGPWPGRVRRSWPAAVAGEEFVVPKRRGMWTYRPQEHHVASWLPVKKGLTPHGLRHGHKTWLDEDDIPAVASEERLGHELPGIIGTYSHTSEEMVRRIVGALQARWERSLRERAAIDPRSPVALLDDLLGPAREEATGNDLPDLSHPVVSDLRARPKKTG